jgi:predicted Fe-Mo cluster-binding NifX family protein
MLIACATNDGIHLINDHFGDADYFHVFHVTETDSTLVEIIQNTSTEETHTHGDPNKAKQILDLLGNKNVDMLMNKAFGKNITIVKQKVLPLVMHDDNIESSFTKIRKHFAQIQETLEQGTAHYIVINKDGVLRQNTIKQ